MWVERPDFSYNGGERKVEYVWTDHTGEHVCIVWKPHRHAGWFGIARGVPSSIKAPTAEECRDACLAAMVEVRLGTA